MCLLLLHYRVRDDAPVVLLANRDEDYDRAFDPPAARGPLGTLAPRDRRAGGTWIGVNRPGLVAAITNRPRGSGTEGRPGARSRGALVSDVLGSARASDARRWLERHLLATEYEPFNLLVLDRGEGFVLHRDERGPAWQPVDPGVHVLTNFHDFDVAPIPEAGRPVPGEPLPSLLARLERLAADRETPLPGDHRICKVGATRGTVCSAVLALPADLDARPALRFANGPPHVTPFEDVAA